MKTNLELLEQLKEPFRSQAIFNTKNGEMADYADIWLAQIPEHQNIYTALSRSFVFENTPEGFDYWNNIRSSVGSSIFDV